MGFLRSQDLTFSEVLFTMVSLNRYGIRRKLMVDKSKGPGKAYRKGLTLMDLFDMFPDDETAEEWFIETLWPDGMRCPHWRRRERSPPNSPAHALPLPRLSGSSSASRPARSCVVRI